MSSENHIDSLLKQLQTLKARNDRGALAALRCINTRQEARAYPVLGSLGALHNPVKRFICLAFAHHPVVLAPKETGFNPNMGHLCQLIKKSQARASDNHPMDARFTRLCAATTWEQMQRLLLQLLCALDAHHGVCYVQLYWDLYHWHNNKFADGEYARRTVARRWAKSYWYQAPKGKEPQDAPAA